MRTTKFDRLITSAPQDRTAAIVTGRPKNGYVPAKKIFAARYVGPPQTIPFPVPEHDLTGSKVGRFTVIGYLRPHKIGSKWLVRCVCSAYEERTGKAIKNPNNDADCCQQCAHLLYLKRRSHWERTGKNLPLSEFI